jgi:ABC-type Fe3+ transport system permease subunit
MKIKLISLILILCCFVSASGYGQTKYYTNEDEIKQYEDGKTSYEKKAKLIRSTFWGYIFVGVTCYAVGYVFAILSQRTNFAIPVHDIPEHFFQNERTSAQASNMAM